MSIDNILTVHSQLRTTLLKTTYSGSDKAKDICLLIRESGTVNFSTGDGGAPVGSCRLNYNVNEEYF